MKLVLTLTLLLSSLAASGPTNPWAILAEMKFHVHYDTALEEIVFTPRPTRAIKRMVGQSITIEGFKTDLLPEAASDATTIFLSKFVDHSFGCYSSYGVESFIEIFPKGSFKTVEDQLYTFRGTFELNLDDPMKLPFRLRDAECLNCKTD